MPLFPTESLFTLSLEIALTCGLLSLFIAAIFRILLGLSARGTERMESAGRAGMILTGVILRAVLLPLFVLGGAFSGLLYLFVDTGWRGVQVGAWDRPFGAGLFLLGMVLSLLTGILAARSCLHGSARVAQATRTSLRQSVRTAFLGSAVGGFVLMGFSIAAVSGALLFLLEGHFPLEEALRTLLMLPAGASVTAFVLRSSASFLSASVATARPAIPHPSAPTDYAQADAARHAGAFLAATAGRASTTFALVLAVLPVAMLIGVHTRLGSPGDDIPVLLPLLIACTGVLASALSALLVRVRKGDENVTPALRSPAVSAAVIIAAGAYSLGFALLSPRDAISLALSAGAGVLPIVFQSLFGGTVEEDHNPTELSHVLLGGPHVALLSGIVWGMRGMIFPLFLAVFALMLSGLVLGSYGIALAATSALAVSGTSAAAQFFRPTAEQAEVIARASALPKQVLTRIRALRRAGAVAEMDGSVVGAIAFALAGIAALLLFTGFVVVKAMGEMPYLLFAGSAGFLILFGLLAFACRALASEGFAFLASLRRAQNDAPIAGNPTDPHRSLHMLSSASAWRAAVLVSLLIGAVVLLGSTLGADVLAATLMMTFVLVWCAALLLREGASAFSHVAEVLEERTGSGPGKDVAALLTFLSEIFRDLFVPLLRTGFLLTIFTALLLI